MKKLLLLSLSTLLFSCSSDYDMSSLPPEELIIGTWRLSAGYGSGFYGNRYDIDGNITWTFLPNGSFEGSGNGKISSGPNKGYDMSFWSYKKYNTFEVYEGDGYYTSQIHFESTETDSHEWDYVRISTDSLLVSTASGGQHIYYRVK